MHLDNAYLPVCVLCLRWFTLSLFLFYFFSLFCPPSLSLSLSCPPSCFSLTLFSSSNMTIRHRWHDPLWPPVHSVTLNLGRPSVGMARTDRGHTHTHAHTELQKCKCAIRNGNTQTQIKTYRPTSRLLLSCGDVSVKSLHTFIAPNSPFHSFNRFLCDHYVFYLDLTSQYMLIYLLICPSCKHLHLDLPVCPWRLWR